MSVNDAKSGTSDSLTVDTVAPVFEGLLSDDPEYKETTETPPTQQSPESASEPGNEVEASTEQAPPVDDKSEETEETEEEQSEESIQATLDPNLKVKVKVDGKDEEITLEEALKGYSRTADYTRKTQELSVQRKAAEEHVAALRDVREKTAAQLAYLEQAVQEQTTVKEPDWQKLQQELSPAEFAGEWAQWAQYKDQLKSLSEQRQEAEALVQRDRALALQEYVKAEQEKLLAAIPEWSDAEKAKAEKAKLIDFAKSLGYAEDELRQLRDHRGLLVLREAMLYREMKAKLPATQARIEKVRTATPGAAGAQRRGPKSKAAQAFERLETTGSQEALAAVFEATVLAD
jgi:hypothetical protein